MNARKHTKEAGSVNGFMISTIALVVVVIAVGSAAIWAYMNYIDQKTNVDSKISIAVAGAKKTQADADEAKFTEREKEPNKKFVGPEDYGRLTFDYPKTWSAYVARDISAGGNYEAYLNRDVVQPVTTLQQYMLRVLIEDKDYDKVVASYEAVVKKGGLKASVATADGNSGTRLDGAFTKDIRGAAVIFKVRDKTVTLRTDADVFKPDFEEIIKTIKFNQ